MSKYRVNYELIVVALIGVGIWALIIYHIMHK